MRRLALLLALLGCATETDAPAEQGWAALGTLTVDPATGQTAALPLEVSAGRTALRVTGDGCFQVDRAQTADGERLAQPFTGPYCADCGWRTSMFRGAGLLVLDGAAAELTRVGFQKVDCRTRTPVATPGTLIVERLDQPEPAEPGIEVRLISSTDVDPDRLAQDLSHELGDLGVVIVSSVAIDPADLRLEGPDALAALEALVATLPARTDGVIDLIVGPCLSRVDPFGTTRLAGFTPRVPGGAGPGDAVFVSRRTCGTRDTRPDPPEAIARVAAHELGHYLGLFHPEEEDGTVDAFAETGRDNLMDRQPLIESAHGLTAGQRARMRAHPCVR